MSDISFGVLLAWFGYIARIYKWQCSKKKNAVRRRKHCVTPTHTAPTTSALGWRKSWEFRFQTRIRHQIDDLAGGLVTFRGPNHLGDRRAVYLSYLYLTTRTSTLLPAWINPYLWHNQIIPFSVFSHWLSNVSTSTSHNGDNARSGKVHVSGSCGSHLQAGWTGRAKGTPLLSRLVFTSSLLVLNQFVSLLTTWNDTDKHSKTAILLWTFEPQVLPSFCSELTHPLSISTELLAVSDLPTQPFLIRSCASSVILHSPLVRLSPLDSRQTQTTLKTATRVIISFMSPTTTALTVFKATLSTQSKGHINENKDNEKTSILRKANVDTITSPVQDKDRDVRAYEHERQRVKHAGEWAKRRARKTTIGGTAVGRPAGARAAHAGRQAKSLKGGKVGLEVDDGYAVTPQGRDTEHTTAKMCDGLGAGLLTKVSLPPSEDGGTDAFKADSGVEVNLSEIMMLSQRKPRKRNGTFFTLVPSMVDQLEKLKMIAFFPADDFEVIPHIRSVIALDDVANVHDMDLDEPWEHIYVINGEGKASDGVSKFGRLTYARVAGTGCQWVIILGDFGKVRFEMDSLTHVIYTLGAIHCRYRLLPSLLCCFFRHLICRLFLSD